MNRALLPSLAAVALAGAIGAGFHTVAGAEDCYGLDAARVCATPDNTPRVEPTGGSVGECVHVGSSCTPVSAPAPVVSRDPKGGPLVDTGCYVGTQTCEDWAEERLPQTAAARP
ncbi:MAG TPA: hypothetical protein VGX28_03930 [Frankiaceae bacterium]|nr:hypothetical protein [Frankiaceae bacterium]